MSSPIFLLQISVLSFAYTRRCCTRDNNVFDCCRQGSQAFDIFGNVGWFGGRSASSSASYDGQFVKDGTPDIKQDVIKKREDPGPNDDQGGAEL